MTLINETAVSPHLKKMKVPRTVADALAIAERSYSALAAPAPAQKQLISSLRTVCRQLVAILEVPLKAIALDHVFEIRTNLAARFECRGIKHRSALTYAHHVYSLLKIARRNGWEAPEDHELLAAWMPVRQALKGKGRGCTSIVDFAIQRKLTPDHFTESDMEEWRQWMFDRGRSLITVQHGESIFRRKMRLAGLDLFSYSIASRERPRYRLKLKDLPESLRLEVLATVHWKTAVEDLEDRDARLMVRPVTGKGLLAAFLELYSYAAVVLGMKGIVHLTQLLVPEIVCRFIDWLVQNRGCKPSSIISKLSGVCFLAETYPALKTNDYRWLRAKLRTLQREKRGQIQARKIDGLPDYSSVAQIAPKLLAMRDDPGNSLTELERAWLTHDSLIYLINSHNPHRSRNTCEACTHPQQQLNLFETEISSELLSQMQVPSWAKELRDRDPGAKFLVGHWTEDATKAGTEVWEVLPNEVRDLFREYLEHYRPILLRKHDPLATNAFFARNGRALTQQTLRRLVARTCVRFTKGRRCMRVKDFRDVVAVHMLSNGATVEEVADRLWHLGPYSTTTARYYIGGLTAADGVVALEDELATLGL